MIDLENGKFNIGDELEIYPGYSFEDFKKSKYYNGQDGIRIIYFEERQVINGRTYYINLFFRNGVIYVISLINDDIKYTPETEKERKLHHDKILAENNIVNGKEYYWGKVISEYDARGNVNSINICYNKIVNV